MDPADDSSLALEWLNYACPFYFSPHPLVPSLPLPRCLAPAFCWKVVHICPTWHLFRFTRDEREVKVIILWGSVSASTSTFVDIVWGLFKMHFTAQRPNCFSLHFVLLQDFKAPMSVFTAELCEKQFWNHSDAQQISNRGNDSWFAPLLRLITEISALQLRYHRPVENET